MVTVDESIRMKEWYKCTIPNKVLKSYMKRNNYHGSIYVGLWLFLLFAFGYLSYKSIGTKWVIPSFLIYGILYSACNARWHECSHGTPFKTSWLNEAVFFIAAAMEQRDMILARWSHARHHSYTSINNVDLEISVTRPPQLFNIIINFFYIKSGINRFKTLALHSLGIPSEAARAAVPEEEFSKMYWWSRAVLMLYLITIGIAIYTGSWLPLLYFGLPRYYGGFVQSAMIFLQHAALKQDVWDHRENSRTVYMNPILGFLYMNMQYHVEHHIYPLIPFHQLPKLHEKIKDQLPTPYKSVWGAYKELIPVLLRQIKDPKYDINRISDSKMNIGL